MLYMSDSFLNNIKEDSYRNMIVETVRNAFLELNVSGKDLQETSISLSNRESYIHPTMSYRQDDIDDENLYRVNGFIEWVVVCRLEANRE